MCILWITEVLWYVGRWDPLIGLTPPIGWQEQLQLTIRCRSAIVVESKFLVASFYCHLTVLYSDDVGEGGFGLSRFSLYQVDILYV